MKKSSPRPLVHWWDWTSVVLLILLLQTLAARLMATEWTESLDLVRGLTWTGTVIGLALGYSTFSQSRARWFSFTYMLFILPLQWTRIIEGPVALEEKLSSIGGRLLFSLSELFSQHPVEDPLFFIAVMSVIFWILGASAGYQLTRHQNFLTAALPSVIGMLVIQNYDNVLRGRILIMAFFILLALLLLGRMNFLQEQQRWKDKRIFLSPETSLDLTGGMAIAAGLLILVAWTAPLSLIKIDAARQTWNRITKPWTEFTTRFENAVSALESQTGGSPGTEFYGSNLELGLGFPLSEEVMFTVEAPELPAGLQPPRYYWRGRVYDRFTDGGWSATGTQRENYSPEDPLLQEAPTATPSNFLFRVGEHAVALLYTPATTVWVSRPGSTTSALAGEDVDILSWSATPRLLPGETYQVGTILNNPNIEQLREAGTDYPEWVTTKYLQLPEDLPQSIRDLAREVTAQAETPYDKASAITRYLRENLEYASTVPEPPLDADPVEWILFSHRKAYCVYYATAEVLMLRSLGIPARMSVGFAQGTGTSGGEAFAEAVEGIEVNTFTVRKNNAHAWPEVYFPGIGWVEFEPTGNQAPLDRPLALRESSPASGLIVPNNLIPELEQEFQGDQNLSSEGNESPVTSATRFPLLYLLLVLISVFALAIFLSRRYALPARLPSLVRTSIERGGAEIPVWVLNWERWVRLSPIEKAFESVNHALRKLNDPLPIHATPVERADKLVSILPEASLSVKILLDEHQTSLYTFRTADTRLAQRTALRLRYQVMLARIRHFWTGKYSPRL